MTPKSMVRSLVRIAKRSLQRRPRIVMTLLCRDEEDIIGYNVAYHLAQGVDVIIATDNASNDRSPALLERFARQGRLHLIREPRLTHDQAVWVTRMAQMAAKKFDADWVINNDADEFWWSAEGTLRTALARMPGDVDCIAVRRFDMLPPRLPGPFFETMIVHPATHTSVYGTTLRPKVCHRGYPDIRVADGNHRVVRPSHVLSERSEHSLQILHFPLRSPAQFERKIRQGAAALASNPRLDRRTGAHWHRLYRNYLLPGRLDSYYQDLAATPERIAAGLANGTLVEDTRIRDALRRIDLALADPDRR